MSNELEHIDALKIVSAELYRSYVLAGKQDVMPSIQSLTETAGAIIAANGNEARPIPASSWVDVFAFARRSWSLCGWRELISAWESNEYSDWLSARRRRRMASEPRQQRVLQPEPMTWLDVWAEAHREGNWVPDSILAKISEKAKESGE